MKKSIIKQSNKLMKLLAVILTTILTLALTCCITSPKKENNLLWLPVPDPILNGESVVKLEGNEVTMPYWYWLEIEKYIIVTEANIEKLK